MQHWPRSSIFVLQGIYSLMCPRTPVGADQDGLAASCATPLSSRPRVQQDCELTAIKRRCSLCYYPPCSSSCREVANRYVRPSEAHPEPPRTPPRSHEGAPTRARLARDSRQGEWPLFFCCMWALFGPWDSVLFPCALIQLNSVCLPPQVNGDSFARWATQKERVPPPEPHGHVGCDRHPGCSNWSRFGCIMGAIRFNTTLIGTPGPVSKFRPFT